MIIQIVRFKDGLDVICGTKDYGTKMELSSPMMFEIRNANLILQHWLPLSVMKGDSVSVDKSEILCVMSPNDDFSEYYSHTVEKMKQVLENKNKESEEELKDVMEAFTELETSKNILIH